MRIYPLRYNRRRRPLRGIGASRWPHADANRATPNQLVVADSKFSID